MSPKSIQKMLKTRARRRKEKEGKNEQRSLSFSEKKMSQREKEDAVRKAIKEGRPIKTDIGMKKVLQIEQEEKNILAHQQIDRLAFADNLPQYLLKKQKEKEEEKKEKKTAIDEAKEIIYGDREKAYGRADKNFNATAELWNGYIQARFKDKGLPTRLNGSDVAIFMVLLKVARHANLYKRDNIVDGIGYLQLIDRIEEEFSIAPLC